MSVEFHLISAIMILATGLAGGIFLGTGLIHMPGDTSSIMRDAYLDVEFPIAYTIATIGFMAVLAVERVVFRAASAVQRPFAYILTLILGLHSLISGTALGLQSQVIVGCAIVVAILAHKGAATSSLGTSFVTPPDIFLGNLLGNTLGSQEGEIAEGVYDSLAAGAFMYIAAVDIINEEFGDAGHSHIPVFAVLPAGLTLMAALALFV